MALTVLQQNVYNRVVALLDVDPSTGERVAYSPTNTGIIMAVLPGFWDLYAAKEQIAPGMGLRDAYVERDCLKVVWASYSDEVNISVGQGSDSESLSDRARTFQAQIDKVQKEIERIETIVAANRPGVMTQITTVGSGPPDRSLLGTPNDPRLGGSPWIRDRERGSGWPW